MQKTIKYNTRQLSSEQDSPMQDNEVQYGMFTLCLLWFTFTFALHLLINFTFMFTVVSLCIHLNFAFIQASLFCIFTVLFTLHSTLLWIAFALHLLSHFYLEFTYILQCFYFAFTFTLNYFYFALTYTLSLLLLCSCLNFIFICTVLLLCIHH